MYFRRCAVTLDCLERTARPTGKRVPVLLSRKRGPIGVKIDIRDLNAAIRSTADRYCKTVPETRRRAAASRRSGRLFFYAQRGVREALLFVAGKARPAIAFAALAIALLRWDRVRVSFGHARICKRCAGLKTGPGYNCGRFFLSRDETNNSENRPPGISHGFS